MSANYPNASMIRRLGAMLYDFLLVIALWMTTTAILVQVMNDGEAMSGLPYQLFLYFELFVFYFVFWRIRGQSLGMQVWKIRCVNLNDQTLTSKQALVRFFWASLSLVPFGLGFFWMMGNPQRITFYDKASESRIIYLGNKPYESEKV